MPVVYYNKNQILTLIYSSINIPDNEFTSSNSLASGLDLNDLY